jgi:hypothetical protein
MIKFFRKIRQQLAYENSISKSFRYAIGEILLVVIGILIALQINNWNEFRKDRKIEKELIAELHFTIKNNHKALEEGLERWQSTTGAIDLILRVINEKHSYHDSLAYQFYKAHQKRGNNLNSLNFSGYRELENKGFNLITNKNLREGVINLFDNHLSGLSATNEHFDVDYSSFHYEYIARNFQLNNKGHIPHNFDSVINDPYYRSILQGLRTIMKRKTNKVYWYLAKSEKILEILEGELGQKKK